jgi:divalent metal cation (Fe/Co/Zn/Cd) transporter
MVRPNLFTVKVNVPGKAPVGLYVINISVVAEGLVLRTAQAGFVVRKVGFDAAVADAAKNRAPLYALITALIAVLLGWVANFAFRRD